MLGPAAFCNQNFRQSAQLGFEADVRDLLLDPRVDPSDLDNSALFDAARFGHKGIVELLMQDPRVAGGDSGNRALCKAARCGHAEVVSVLLRHASVDPSCWENRPLMQATRHGQWRVIETLVADTRVEGLAVSAALRMAVKMGSCFVAEILLRRRRWCTSREVLRDCLKDARANADVMMQDFIVRELLSLMEDDPDGVTMDDVSPETGDVWGLCDFSRLGRADIVRGILADRRVSADVCTKALMQACVGGHPDVVRLLLKDTRADASHGPLVFAVTHGPCGQEDLVHLVLATRNVDPSEDDDEALVQACRRGLENMARLLLADARTNPCSQECRAVLEAVRGGHVNILRLLLADSRVSANAYAALHADVRGRQLVYLGLKDFTRETVCVGDMLVLAAVCRGNADVLSDLLRVTRTPCREMMLLDLAALGGHVSVLDVLDPKYVVKDYGDALVAAARMGHEHVVAWCLDRRPSDDCVQEAFHVAVDNDHVRLVESLLTDHAVGQGDVDEALCRAVRNCQPVIVRLLLQHRALRDEEGGSGGALRGARGQRVPTSSVLLSQAADSALAHMLLDSGRVDKDDISPEALEVAIRAGFSSLVDRFVSDLQCCGRLPSSFWGDKLPLKTVVVAAVEAGSDVVLTSVLGLLRFVTTRAELEPWTAVKVLFEGMMAATKAGRMDMLTWLLTHLQEVNSSIVHEDVLQSFRMPFRELLTAACRLGQARIADMLWTTLPPAVGVTEDQLWVEGAEKTFVGDLVSVGCRNGHVAVVEVVLTRGKHHHPVSQMFLDQMLVSVVASGDLQLVEVLLRHGADPTWNFYTRPLELAVEIGLVDILRVFLAHPKVEPAHSAALLDLAVRHDHAEVVELLLEHCRSHVDVGLYGKVLHVALSAGYGGVVRTLLSCLNVCVPEVSEDDVGLYSDPLFKCHSVIAGHRLVSDDDFVRMVESELTSAQRLCLLKFAAGYGKPRMMKVMLCVMDRVDLASDGPLEEDLQLKCGSEETSRVWQQWRSVR
jgi:ankyrin repeat protein